MYTKARVTIVEEEKGFIFTLATTGNTSYICNFAICTCHYPYPEPEVLDFGLYLFAVHSKILDQYNITAEIKAKEDLVLLSVKLTEHFEANQEEVFHSVLYIANKHLKNVEKWGCGGIASSNIDR